MSARTNPAEDTAEILVAEDSPTQAERLRGVLENQGYRVTLAGDGRQALAFLGERQPALVISDINMPEMNGYELCTRIKGDVRFRDIPVILLTSLADVEDVLEGLACGADSFITKPYSEEYLISHIERTLAGRALRRSDRATVEVKISLAGTSHVISADPQQMLSLLFSTYDAAVHRNAELVQTQDDLSLLNEHLEDLVEQRTALLSTEITERKQAEEELKASNQQLLEQTQELSRMVTVVTDSNDAITIQDLEGNITAWNAGAIKMYGYSEQEAFKMNVSDLVPEEYSAEALNFIASLKKGELVESLETKRQTKDGKILDIWMVVTKLVDENGKLIRAATTERDITERKQAEEHIRRQLQRLQTLRDIDQAISGSTNLNVTLNVLIDRLIDNLEVDAGAILLYRPAMQVLEYITGQGFQTDAFQDMTERIGEGQAGKVALERRTIYIPDLSLETVRFKRIKILRKEKFVAYFGVPLLAKGQLVGVLEVFHRSPFDPSETWMNFLETLAGQAAIAIDNSQLFEGLQRSNLEIILAYDSTLEGWAKALELRDQETEGHSRRVVELTMKMARAMGMSENELGHVRRGALLHDIGKMGIPDNILHKPGPLDESEWEIMREHPTYAYNWLSSIRYLQPALEIPQYHHEKWDGTGYPRGLKGEEIPLAARIFAIVDVWDALSSDRPYRDAWPKEKIIAHLQEQVGKHFDPQVVEVFLGIVAENDSASSNHLT